MKEDSNLYVIWQKRLVSTPVCGPITCQQQELKTAYRHEDRASDRDSANLQFLQEDQIGIMLWTQQFPSVNIHLLVHSLSARVPNFGAITAYLQNSDETMHNPATPSLAHKASHTHAGTASEKNPFLVVDKPYGVACCRLGIIIHGHSVELPFFSFLFFSRSEFYQFWANYFR